MAIKNSTIYFYELKLCELLHKTNPDGTQAMKKLSIKKFKDEFIDILNCNLNEYNTMSLGVDQEYSLEIKKYGKIINGNDYNVKEKGKNSINEDMKWCFGKLGGKQELINFQLRNLKTLKPEEIAKQINQFFECFSYFYGFFEDKGDETVCILAFLKAQSAPNIRNLALIRSEMSKEDYIIKIDPIITDDALLLISKKEIINTIKYSVTLPPDAKLSKLFRPTLLNSGENDFDNAIEADSLQLELTLKGSRGKNLINNKEVIKSIVDKLKLYTIKNNGKKLDIKAKAKNEGEQMLEYDFVDNKIISKAVFNIENTSEWEDEVKRTMLVHYMEKRKDLLNSVR